MTAYGKWSEDAACRQADPDLFFPVGVTGQVRARACVAQLIGRACPAQTQCPAWAVDHGVTDGVREGLQQTSAVPAGD